jgi:hypothetical protein
MQVKMHTVLTGGAMAAGVGRVVVVYPALSLVLWVKR